MDGPPLGRRVFPDTNVLYPISLLDLIMRLAEVGAHTVVWSDDLLAELEQVWAEGRAAGKRVPNTGGAASAIAGIRRTFPASLVPRSAYEARIDGMPGDDHDDKPHLAAAEAGRATHLVTRDRAGGFPHDGNGRVGRCLVHTLLRRETTSSVLPPLSIPFARPEARYVEG